MPSADGTFVKHKRTRPVRILRASRLAVLARPHREGDRVGRPTGAARERTDQHDRQARRRSDVAAPCACQVSRPQRARAFADPFAHRARIFYTASYGKAREFDWMVGMGLLVATLGLSFTGDPLPWGRLAS